MKAKTALIILVVILIVIVAAGRLRSKRTPSLTPATSTSTTQQPPGAQTGAVVVDGESQSLDNLINAVDPEDFATAGLDGLE